jgi:hypothetical protein
MAMTCRCQARRSALLFAAGLLSSAIAARIN